MRNERGHRWRLRFRLSTLLLVTAVVGLGLGWLMDRHRLSTELEMFRGRETRWGELELYRKRVLILQRAMRDLSARSEWYPGLNAEVSRLHERFEVTIADDGR